METLDQFAARLSRQVGCFYKSNKVTWSLKKYPSASRGRMGVFAWVGERKKSDRFRVSTYKCLADEQGIRDADEEKCGAQWVPKGQDDGQANGLAFYVRKDSSEYDFQKAVRALRVICANVVGQGKCQG